MFVAAMLLAVGMQHPLYVDPPKPGPNDPIRNPSHKPVRIAGQPARYTEAAARARISGIVIVEVLIERDGRVSAARVVKPLPFGLSENALSAVRTWRYKPVVEHGRPVRVLWYQTVTMNPP